MSLTKPIVILTLALVVADCAAAQTQTDMNVAAGGKFRAADARLNRTYRALLAKVTPAGKTKLQTAQRAWLAWRDSQCAFETAGTADGSIHPTIVAGCLESLTREQDRRLGAQLRCQEGDLSCGGQ